MSKRDGSAFIFKMEIKDTDVSNGHAVGKKIYFVPIELEPELPRIFRAAIVHSHPENIQEDFAKKFLDINRVVFRELRSHPQERGKEEQLLERVGFPPKPHREKKIDLQQKIREKFTKDYANYVLVIPLLVSQRTSKEVNPFSLLPAKSREETNLAAPPYYPNLKRMSKTHAYLIHKGQVHQPICSACAFVTLGISGDCHPLDKVCRDRMSIPGLSLAEEVNKNTEKYVQDFEGDSYDYLLPEPTEHTGVPDSLEAPGTPPGDRRHDPVVPPGGQQLADVVSGPISE